MIDRQDFWNLFLETLPREKLVEIELKNFRRYMRYAKKHSEFYRKKLAGVEPDDIRNIKNLMTVIDGKVVYRS